MTGNSTVVDARAIRHRRYLAGALSHQSLGGQDRGASPASMVRHSNVGALIALRLLAGRTTAEDPTMVADDAVAAIAVDA